MYYIKSYLKLMSYLLLEFSIEYFHTVLKQSN